MNLTFKKISIKNFLSFGNVPEEIDLIKSPYRIIVGQNKDKSDSQDDANGVGKSSIYQSIHYAIFGKSIGNKVTLPSLVNNVNKKNMLVTLDFSVDDVNYTIERGRNPVVLKLYKENVEITDESLGDSRDTQTEIERIIGITSDVFSQIVCLSSGVPVFLLTKQNYGKSGGKEFAVQNRPKGQSAFYFRIWLYAVYRQWRKNRP